MDIKTGFSGDSHTHNFVVFFIQINGCCSFFLYLNLLFVARCFDCQTLVGIILAERALSKYVVRLFVFSQPNQKYKMCVMCVHACARNYKTMTIEVWCVCKV